jgi:DNA-binding MltR family transcriptional regulator
MTTAGQRWRSAGRGARVNTFSFMTCLPYLELGIHCALVSLPPVTAKYSLKGYEEFQAKYKGESDRAVIILATSYVEAYLEEFLKKVLVDDKTMDTLFEGYGPLSTFAAKIDMGFFLGLLSRDVRSQLHLLRKIRNLCAHEPETLNFASERIGAMCYALLPVMGKAGPRLHSAKNARAEFIFTTFWVVIHLEYQAKETSRPKECKMKFEIQADSNSRQSTHPSP